jgi:hypothetical protein
MGPPDLPGEKRHDELKAMILSAVSFSALDPLPCHAGVAGPDTVDDGPLEGAFLARSRFHPLRPIRSSVAGIR